MAGVKGVGEAGWEAVDLPPGERGCLAPTLSGTDPAFAQVPRAFVNLVNILQIINLRELYHEENVGCPRLILR